jgi:hypothetical protein
MGRQGYALSDSKIKTIVRLLASTDLPISLIAERLGCSKSVVAAINRKHGIRFYEGRRNRSA